MQAPSLNTLSPAKTIVARLDQTPVPSRFKDSPCIDLGIDGKLDMNRIDDLIVQLYWLFDQHPSPVRKRMAVRDIISPHDAINMILAKRADPFDRFTETETYEPPTEGYGWPIDIDIE